MPGQVLILGAAGNFGKRIAGALTEDGIPVILAGRTLSKCNALKDQLPAGLAKSVSFDVYQDLESQLIQLRPSLVINTCGPFQGGSYSVADACIRQKIHYIDLADGRNFVTSISVLDQMAKDAGIAVVSGASTVPGLSSAVLEEFRNEFSAVNNLKYGISPGQKAERGLATTEGILSYVGKPLKPVPGALRAVYGWQSLYRQRYPEIGTRWMANCDIPDLDLLPEHYGLKSIQFSAGLELSLLHLGLWGLSWLVRAGLPLALPRYAGLLLKASNRFDRFGSADGGMHMIISGTDHNNKPLTLKWFIIAKSGDGPHIPTAPAISLAKQIVRGEFAKTGAMPCLGLVSLRNCLEELAAYDIETHTHRN